MKILYKIAYIITLVALSMSTMTPAVSAQELSNEFIRHSDEGIYDYAAMDNLNVDPLDVNQYESLDDIIYDLLVEYGIAEDQIGFAYTDLITGEEVFINEDEQMIVASLYKVPMVAMYIDLIDQGILSWDSELPYIEEYFQDGAGDITANPDQDYYSLDELAYQAIVYSDNTASMILYYYYVNNFGSFREGLLDFVEYYDVPEIYYYDNCGSAYLMNRSLQKISTNSAYDELVNMMMQTTPKQFFSLYVNSIATKYGRYENMLNDSGIFYLDGQPMYTVILMVKDEEGAELFISELGLRVNEWFMAGQS